MFDLTPQVLTGYLLAPNPSKDSWTASVDIFKQCEENMYVLIIVIREGVQISFLEDVHNHEFIWTKNIFSNFSSSFSQLGCETHPEGGIRKGIEGELVLEGLEELKRLED